jgi:hypothetical protein
MRTVLRLVLCAGILIGAACGNPIQPQPSPVAGVYDLRLELACTGLPAEVRTRTYIAQIAGNHVTLSGGTFWMASFGAVMNDFVIDVDGRDVRLKLDARRPINERTSPGTYLQITGESIGTVTRARDGSRTMNGPLAAQVRYGQNTSTTEPAVACDASRSTFQFTPHAGAVPPVSVVPALISLDVRGVDSLNVHASTSVTATGMFADGSWRDVTADGVWESSNGGVLAVDAGRVTGVSTGEATLKVTVTHPENRANLLRSERRIFVVPEGSFAFQGEVRSGSEEFSFALEGVTVNVTAGSMAGFSAKTDANGRFFLPGVVGPMTVEFSLRSFQTLTCAIPSVTGPQSWAVHLAPPPRKLMGCTRVR